MTVTVQGVGSLLSLVQPSWDRGAGRSLTTHTSGVSTSWIGVACWGRGPSWLASCGDRFRVHPRTGGPASKAPWRALRQVRTAEGLLAKVGLAHRGFSLASGARRGPRCPSTPPSGSAGILATALGHHKGGMIGARSCGAAPSSATPPSAPSDPGI